MTDVAPVIYQCSDRGGEGLISASLIELRCQMENHICITHDDSSGDLPATQPLTDHIEMLLTDAKDALPPTQTNNSYERDIRISIDSVKLRALAVGI